MTISALEKLNKSLVQKKVDKFYASFLRMPENISNVLGRQVESVERPSPTFTPIEDRFKGVKQQQVGTMEFSDVSIIFKDDNFSFVSTAIYTQLYKQTGKIHIEEFNHAKFDILVKCYDGENSIVEEFTMRNCFITSVTHNESAYTESTNNKITVTVAFDSVDYKLVDIPTDLTGYLV